jgi:phosphoglycolate phosphatase-like HAD superfamily hydrolase
LIKRCAKFSFTIPSLAAKNANVNSIAVLSGYDDVKILRKFTDVIFNDALEAAIYLQTRKK